MSRRSSSRLWECTLPRGRGRQLHYSEASVYLGTRLWSTKSGFVEMPKEGYIEGIPTIAEQAGLHVRGGRGAATPGIKDKPKTKDDEEYIGRELHSIHRQIVGKVQYITEEARRDRPQGGGAALAGAAVV